MHTKEVELKQQGLSKRSPTMIKKIGVFDMTAENITEKKPVLYWVALVIMFTSFVTVVLS